MRCECPDHASGVTNTSPGVRSLSSRSRCRPRPGPFSYRGAIAHSFDRYGRRTHPCGASGGFYGTVRESRGAAGRGAAPARPRRSSFDLVAYAPPECITYVPYLQRALNTGLRTTLDRTDQIRDHTRHKASALRSIPPPQPASLRLRPPWLWAQCRKPRRPPHPSPQVRGACAVHPCRPCQSTIQSHLIESQTAHLARKGCCTMCESGALKRA